MAHEIAAHAEQIAPGVAIWTNLRMSLDIGKHEHSFRDLRIGKFADSEQTTDEP